MKWFSLFLLLFVAILLESTITNLPIVLVVLLCSAVILRNPGVFLWGFFSGIMLDALKLQTIGESSLFFLLFLLTAFLYDRKFEVQSVPFVLLFSFLGSVLYMWIFGNNYIFVHSVVNAMIAVGVFLVWVKMRRMVA